MPAVKKLPVGENFDKKEGSHNCLVTMAMRVQGIIPKRIELFPYIRNILQFGTLIEDALCRRLSSEAALFPVRKE
jgi:hypothetical protein